LILGCTHYPLLEHFISEAMEEHVETISSAEETAAELSTILQHQNLLAPHPHKRQAHHFFTTDQPALFSQIATEWLGVDVQAEQVALPVLFGTKI
jgi:glutamate racemase